LAAEKDQERTEAKAEGLELGLFHGIPISVKDVIFQYGKLSTFGFAYLCEDVIREDAVVLT